MEFRQGLPLQYLHSMGFTNSETVSANLRWYIIFTSMNSKFEGFRMASKYYSYFSISVLDL